MNFRRGKMNNLYLRETSIENIFIAEYLPDADGDFVKVYLTALMYADRMEADNQAIALQLGMDVEDVMRAWNYWEKMGIIRKHYPDPADRFRYQVEFRDLREQLFALSPETDEEAWTSEESPLLPGEMDDAVVRETLRDLHEITGRMLGGKEEETVIRWIFQEQIDRELIYSVYRYCIRRQGKNSFQYIETVLDNWIEQGVRTASDAEAYLKDHDERHNQYRRVMRALGFFRGATEDEMRKMDRWFDEMGFSMDRVLEACSRTSGISNPNINYVNKILTSWNQGKSGQATKTGTGPEGRQAVNPVAAVRKEYEQVRRKHEEEESARRKAAYQADPRIREIDEEIRRISRQITNVTLRGSGGDRKSVPALKVQIRDLNAEKSARLTDRDLPPDYLEPIYECQDCHDTGVLDTGERCHCFKERLKKYMN